MPLCSRPQFVGKAESLTKRHLKRTHQPAIIDIMAQLVVRKLEPELVRRLKRRAVDHGVSAEEEHRRILRRALLEEDDFPDLKGLLLAMPDVGEDKIFERVRDYPQDLDLS